MLELLSPAGSPEALTAAVQAGADAVYLGFGDFNARRNAKNFTGQELREAVRYCHVRGVKVYLTLNTLLTDRELPKAADTARTAASAGIDAVLIQDLGVLDMLRRTTPELEIHGSTQLTVHSLEGVLRCAELGMKRIVLSRELSRDAIEYICKNSPIEIETFVHGALCMCYSGQCCLSSIIGGRSGNRGLCAQPCRLPYGWEGRSDSYPLSLKDMSLASHLAELSDIGVKCVKIEGRMKRPEYVAVVTDIYSRAIREGREPTIEEMAELEAVFSRQGFTDGYFTDRVDPKMFGVRESTGEPKELFARTRARFLSGREAREKIPVSFAVAISENTPSELRASDPDGNSVTVHGPTPEPARTRALTDDTVKTQLLKTGNTPFSCNSAEITISPDLSLPVSALNALRRDALEKLEKIRGAVPSPVLGEFVPAEKVENSGSEPDFTVSMLRMEQLSPEICSLYPKRIYLPAGEIVKNPETTENFLNQGARLSVTLPRISWDNERDELTKNLKLCRDLGIEDALIGTLDLIEPAKSLGFKLRGDFGTGVYNSHTAGMLKAMGFTSLTASFELNLSQIRDLSKCLETELIVYGRLPLMVTEQCIIKNRDGKCACTDENVLTDRKGNKFPVISAPGCRNEILNGKPLFLADKPEYKSIGINCARLIFTTESTADCAGILRRYMDMGEYTPADYTRGLYFRSVQ